MLSEPNTKLGQDRLLSWVLTLKAVLLRHQEICKCRAYSEDELGQYKWEGYALGQNKPSESNI